MRATAEKAKERVKGRALRRALDSKDAHRLTHDTPALTTETVMITPEMAQEMLQKNKNNRPVNWNRVEDYAGMMGRHEWVFHSQGIDLDEHGNILTGQNRLWAIVYSEMTIPMRVSRGCPAAVAPFLDRGTPQSARDLAARRSGRKHTPQEGMIARARLAAEENHKPSKDVMADMIYDNRKMAEVLLLKTKGTKKTKPILMIMGVLSMLKRDEALALVYKVEDMANALGDALAPQDPDKCWGRGVAFALAMEQARKVVAFYKVKK
ncbi:MAG: hypothetical protein GY769_07795 [bacterium]|nr:hypothetical protein [bacterium]